jgi:hypothetical protein
MRSERMAAMNRQAIDTAAALRAISGEGFTGEDVASIIGIDSQQFDSGVVGLASTLGILTNTVIDLLISTSMSAGVELTAIEVYDRLRATVGQPNDD